MENLYNQLLAKSKTVGDFYENVYAPVLQTLPWIEQGNGLTFASVEVLGNMAFPVYKFASYKNQEENPVLIDCLSTRCKKLDSSYKQMQDELRPVLAKIPSQDRTWEKLQEMVPKWKNLCSSDMLPNSMHQAVEDSFAVTSTTGGTKPLSSLSVPTDQEVLGKLMADKIKSLQAKGESVHAIAVTFGSSGYWLERSFLNSLR